MRMLMMFAGAFQLYDINGDGTISYDEMLKIVEAIYKMTGQVVRLPPDEDTPEKVSTVAILVINAAQPILLHNQRVEKIFRMMDRDKDAQLTFEEFVEGSKQDPTIVQVSANQWTLPTFAY